MRHDHRPPPSPSPFPPAAPPPAARGLDRRRFLGLAAVTGASAAVVGCGATLLTRADASSPVPTSTPTSSPSTTASVSPSTAASGVTTPSTAAASGTAFGLGEVSTEHLTITVADGYRHIASASYPDWAIDSGFRYPGTPAVSNLSFKVTTSPAIAAKATQVRTGQVFGVLLNSVVCDPATAEFYNRVRDSKWNETPRGLDSHGCHTRPDGFYHCHKITSAWASDASVHSPLVAWAADGFPVYLRYGYTDAQDPSRGVKNLQSSYRLKSGSRPSSSTDPGGTYDGTYVADYEYVAGLGDLDECGGRQCVTPEFPAGTYAYFLTDTWPSVPSWLRGTPDPTFAPGYGGGSVKRPS
jgi:hypothetical protein